MRPAIRRATIVDRLTALGRPWPAAIGRGWLIAHLMSLAGVLVVLLYAARGQYFYYDEWDFLADSAQWDLLASHVGHLSLLPQLLTTILKLAFGLHSYWPFLLPAFAVHLLVVHLLWRLLVRLGANMVLALTSAVLFAVLAPGAENTMWAFQVGFMAPLALGLGALLIILRPSLPTRSTVAVTVLLVVAIACAGTALPMILIAAIALVTRHGWRSALVPIGVPAVLYAAWYLAYNTGPHPWDWMRANSLEELVIGVPRFVLAGFLDSVGDMLPRAVLAVPLLVALAVWTVLSVRRTGVRRPHPSVILLVGLVVFAVLTALSRVALGDGAASAGRYAYVYGLLLCPLAVTATTALVGLRWGGRRWAAVAVVAVVVAVLAGYNALGLIRNGETQARVEETVPRAMSAALDEIGCDDPGVRPDATPSALVAPQLGMAQLCRFAQRGWFAPIAYGPADALDVRVNVFGGGDPVDVVPPSPGVCRGGDDDGITVNPATDLVFLPVKAQLVLTGEADGVRTQHAAVTLPAGVSRLVGVDGLDDIRVSSDAIDVCVFPDTR